MKSILRGLVVLAILAGAAAAGYRPVVQWWELSHKTRFRTLAVTEGSLEFIVRSTGTVRPVRSVAVGSFVSGPVKELYVDYNSRVTEGQLLAKIDPRIYEAAKARDEAALETQTAQVARVEAELQRAINDENRSKKLRERNQDFIADTEMDQFRFARLSLEAQLKLAKASVLQAEATLQNSTANVAYTDIVAPEDGIVIDKQINKGQTLAAQFQAPELFLVAHDMDKVMHVFASVDEADIGLIREAKDRELPVKFRVDAYGDVFEGHIYQIRTSPTTTQNVVTYPVIVATPNLELKLLPGMTASLEFQVDVRDDVVKIPNAALRYFPRPEHVRAEDKHLVEPSAPGSGPSEPADRRKRGGLKHVWIDEGGLLRAVEVRVGISDSSFTELLEGDLATGQALAIGVDETPLVKP